MSDRLMSADDLKRITGKVRYGKQAEWFKMTFGHDVIRSSDGSLIVTWVLYDALVARRSGTEQRDSILPKRVEICSPFV